MKKSIAIICFLSLLLFSACSSIKKQIAAADGGYTCDAVVDYGEIFSLNITADIVGGGIFSFTVNSPENINGLDFSFNNNEMALSYKEVKSQNGFPSEYGGFAKILNEIFLKVTTGDLTIPYENGKYVYNGKTQNYTFSVVFNVDGFPLTITSENQRFKATFSNWKY